VRLVIVGTIVIIVPLVALFLFHTLLFSTPVFNMVACISVTDDITQVAVIPITPSSVLLWWSDVVGFVLMRTLPVVRLVTLGSVFIVVNRVNYGCCIQKSIAWRCLTCVLTSSLSLGRWG
jgi:hypothetical protein